MTFDPLKGGSFAEGERFLASYANQLNVDLPRALDGHEGGAYNPTAPIIIGGQGIRGGLHTPSLLTVGDPTSLVLPDWAQIVWGWLVGGGGSGGDYDSGTDNGKGGGGGGSGQPVPFFIRVSDLTIRTLVFAYGAGSSTSANAGSTTLTVDSTLLFSALGGVVGASNDPPGSTQDGAGGRGYFGGGQGSDPNNIGGVGGNSTRTGYDRCRLGFGETVTGTSPGAGWGDGLEDSGASNFFSYFPAPIQACPQTANAGRGGTADSGFNGGGGGGGAGFFDPALIAADGATPGGGIPSKGGRGYGAGAGGSNGGVGIGSSSRSAGNNGCALVVVA